MAREILFRGKRIDNGEWVLGDLIHGVGYWKKDKMYILPIKENLASLPGCHPLDGYEVDPATVGQLHNGLSKKAGISIFEGDIIRHDLEAGLGQPKRIWLTETVRSVEFDFHYYSNVRLIGTIHDTHLTQQS